MILVNILAYFNNNKCILYISPSATPPTRKPGLRMTREAGPTTDIQYSRPLPVVRCLQYVCLIWIMVILLLFSPGLKMILI